MSCGPFSTVTDYFDPLTPTGSPILVAPIEPNRGVLKARNRVKRFRDALGPNRIRKALGQLLLSSGGDEAHK
jgi:hypothetical protein